MILVGDCRERMADLPACSVDAVVTDPPYGLEFMGKDWDRPWAVGFSETGYGDGKRMERPSFGSSRNPMCRACRKHQRGARSCTCAEPDYDERPADSSRLFGEWCLTWAVEALRVLKPGGHLVAFGGTRTCHRLACAIEDAGFEIRDTLMWAYSAGFPKSHSVHKATIANLESRYGQARCDCMDAGDGSAHRDGLGRDGRPDAGAGGGPGSVPPSPARPGHVPVLSGGGHRALRQLRDDDPAQAEGSTPVGTAVLHPGMCGRGSEAPGLRDAALRAGLEEQAGGDPGAGQGMPGLRQDAGGERVGPPRSPSGAVPLRGDEPAGESGGPVRPVPPRDRSGDRPSPCVDPGRREARRVLPDGDGGRRPALGRVCSWCGLPDPAWLTSLQPLGTALKPAWEPIVLARKPLAGTVAANVLEHGTGAINIDGCRVGTDERPVMVRTATAVAGTSMENPSTGATSNGEMTTLGRWPANVVLDEEAGDMLDAQTGVLVSGLMEPHHADNGKAPGIYGAMPGGGGRSSYGDQGGASRFFYCAKAAADERPEVEGVRHPTVKPLALIRWLVRLVTPPGGTVLDPFLGSGTTAEAALLEGFDWVGCERTVEYLPLIQARLDRFAAGRSPGIPQPRPRPPQVEGQGLFAL